MLDSGFESQQLQDIFLFSKTAILAPRPTLPPIQCLPGIFPEGKPAKVKNGWRYTSVSHMHS
jgi:hypothetical protein